MQGDNLMGEWLIVFGVVCMGVATWFLWELPGVLFFTGMVLVVTGTAVSRERVRRTR